MEKKEFIMCAAIRRKETCDCPKVYNVKDIYDCELGWRHPDILHKFRGIVSTSMSDQGFFTSKGRFVGRDEAENVARESGQLVGGILGSVLTSEDLW